MSDESIDLPKGWECAKLQEVTEIIMGQSPPGDSYNLEGIGTPLINGPVEFGGSSPFAKTIRSKFTTSPTKFCREGDLILCVRGSTTGRMNISGFEACIGRGVAAIRAYIYQEYLNFFIHSIQQEIYRLGTGSTFPNVSADTLNEISISVPPIAEQKRIVAKIEELRSRTQKAREALEAIPGMCDCFRQSVLAAAFRGDLTADWREQNPNFKIGENFAHVPRDSKGWVALKAEDVCNVQSGSTPKGKPFTEVGDIPYLKVYNIVEQQIDFDYRPQFIPLEVHHKELKRCVTLPGDVLMNIVGPPLGKIAIVTDQFQEWNINQALVLFRPKAGLFNRYLYYFFREGKFIREINSETKGSVGQVNISLTQCRKCLIPIPSEEEQQEIVQQIESTFQIIDRIYQQYEQAKARLEKLDQSILAQAFRGELVPQDPNDEPVSVLLDRIREERVKISDRSSTKRKR